MVCTADTAELGPVVLRLIAAKQQPHEARIVVLQKKRSNIPRGFLYHSIKSRAAYYTSIKSRAVFYTGINGRAAFYTGINARAGFYTGIKTRAGFYTSIISRAGIYTLLCVFGGTSLTTPL